MTGAAWTLPGYGVERLLGFGSTGEVWRARELDTGEVVALKRVRLGTSAAQAQAPERLRREAALLAAVSHPHLLRLRQVLTTRRASCSFWTMPPAGPWPTCCGSGAGSPPVRW